jgi:hypothetical protein
MSCLDNTPWSVSSVEVENNPWGSQNMIIYKDGEEWFK